MKAIAELEALIEQYQASYYSGEGDISDTEFDALWDELKKRAPDSPVLAKVGAEQTDGFPKAKHIIPMGSQDKAADEGEFRAWAEKLNLDSYLVQHKLDGASLELQYSEGNLVRAITRGDGIIGDVITANALKMKGVVAKLPAPWTGGVRGEVLMFHDIWKEKYTNKANCRNAANGLMRRKDGVGSEDLTLLCYDCTAINAGNGENAEKNQFKTELDKINWLKSCGFFTTPVKECRTIDEVIAYHREITAGRAKLPYDIDGLVVKDPISDPGDLKKARPEKQIAFKFPLETAITTLIAVEWSESGATYTPIGIVAPVRLAGTTVQRANLNNPAAIRAMGLQIGSKVTIVKRGEIIPKIEGLAGEEGDGGWGMGDGDEEGNGERGTGEERHLDKGTSFNLALGFDAQNNIPHGAKQDGTAGIHGEQKAFKHNSPFPIPHSPFPIPSSLLPSPFSLLPSPSSLLPLPSSILPTPIDFPTVCGTCGTALVDEGRRLYCPNTGCPKRVAHRLEKWVSVLDIRELGEKLLKQLFDAGRLKRVADLYTLTAAELAEYERMGELSGLKVAHYLRTPRKISLAAFVAGFDFEGVGETIMETVTQAGFDTPGKLRAATVDELADVYGLGKITAQTIVSGLRECASDMNAVLAAGIISIAPPRDDRELPLKGKSFCFTGELKTMKRTEAEAQVRERGGSAKASVVKELSYLVTNDTESGSAKNKKAHILGVPIISEEDFLKLL